MNNKSYFQKINKRLNLNKMKDKSRRDFIKLSAISATASLISIGKSTAKPSVKTSSLKLGLASYTCRKFNQAQTIAMGKRAGLDYMCFKSMHLPLDSSIQELKDGAKNVKDAGMELYAGGVIYMTSKEQVDQAFEYAKNAGMSMIIGVPDHDLLQYTNDKIKAYNIKCAIHNHGPGDEKYPGPGSVYEKIKDLDPRFGLCMDIGHTQRIGQDPAEAAKKYFPRLFDIHMKDVTKAAEDGETVEIGRGVIDIPKLLKVLVDKSYDGVLSFEYEKDEDDPLPGLSESVGYVKGCLAVIGK